MALVSSEAKNHSSSGDKVQSLLHNRDNLAKLFNHKAKKQNPRVRDADSQCGASITTLKKGFADYTSIIEKGDLYTDEDFTGVSTIYGPNASSYTKNSVDDALSDGSKFFKRWQLAFPDGKVFNDDGSPTWSEPNQGGAGTCYMMSAMSTVAEWPELIRELFLVDERNEAGIYGIRFFIRGRPWYVTVDDDFLFQFPGSDPHYYWAAQADDSNQVMWAPILEKAWAKVKGNYDAADGGFVVNGITSITGVPVFHYGLEEKEGESTLLFELNDVYYTSDELFELFQNGNNADFIMGTGTNTGSDTTTNSCGIARGHAYSILDAFTMTDASDEEHKMLLVRNPWGHTEYTADWYHADDRWTDALVAQVPMGVDPRVDQTQSNSDNAAGVFTVPMSRFVGQADESQNCFDDVQIGHFLDNDGYTSKYFDAVDMDTNSTSYSVTPTSGDGDLYFTVNGYYQKQIEESCLEGAYSIPQTGGDMQSNYPMIYYKVTTDSKQDYVFQFDQFAKPLVIKEGEYNSGEQITIDVDYYFSEAHPHKDYTLKLYSKSGGELLDSDNENTVFNYDGTEPSGFTASSDDDDDDDDSNNGSDDDSDDEDDNEPMTEEEAEEAAIQAAEEATTLTDLFTSGAPLGVILSVLFQNPFLFFSWF